VKWGKFEEERLRVDKAREVFQTALEFYGDDEEQIEKAQAVFNAFAKMETRLKEYERARVISKVCILQPDIVIPILGFSCTCFPVCFGPNTSFEIRSFVRKLHKVRKTTWHAHYP
jgi:hypothetical protein